MSFSDIPEQEHTHCRQVFVSFRLVILKMQKILPGQMEFQEKLSDLEIQCKNCWEEAGKVWFGTDCAHCTEYLDNIENTRDASLSPCSPFKQSLTKTVAFHALGNLQTLENIFPSALWA